MVTIVLLKVDWMWAMPLVTTLFVLRFLPLAGFAFASAMILALPAHWSALRSLAGARVSVGSLTTTRQTAPMAESAVAAEVHEPLNVHVDLTTKVTFDLEVLVDALADPLDIGLIEIVSALAL
jgi:hypothetical protein